MNFCSGKETKRQLVYDSKISEWAAGRAELVELQRKAFTDRQTLELQLRKEEHTKKLDLELAILEIKKEDAQKQKEHNELKARLEIRILQLQRDALLPLEPRNRNDI